MTTTTNNQQTLTFQTIDVNELVLQMEGLFERKLNELLNKQIPRSEKKLLTAPEMMDWFKVSRITLWRYERNGLLHPVKIGKNKLYDLDEVRELFANK